jgi:hypothetical protein
MPWLKDGSMSCDQCGTVFASCATDHKTSQVARANGWSHASGVNNSGEPYEGMLCGGCRGVQATRKRIGPQGYEDTPMFEMEP